VEVCDGSGVVIGSAMIAAEVPPGGTKRPTCPADVAPPGPPPVGGKGVVNVDDLLAVINTWGQTGPPGQVQGDIAPPGGNGLVNVDDLLAVINAWGPCE